MKYKSIIILALTIVLISIAGVSAADANDTVIASDDEGEIDLSANSIETDDLKTSPEDTPLTQPDNEGIISEHDNGTFKALQDKISNANSGDTITLENNYALEDNFINEYSTNRGIVISKSLTIDGQGHTIDAQHKSRIFYVTANNVTIKNINFVNGKLATGCAIFIELKINNCNVLNCSFINNKIPYDNVIGSAIYVNRANNCSFYNCSFINNSGGQGGAIFFCSANDFKVYNCSFINNSVNMYGGAITLEVSLNGIISSCYFVNNSARQGNAICVWNVLDYVNANLKINNNIFINHNGDEINFKNPDTTSNIDYNWFGANSIIQPTFNNINASHWLHFTGISDPEEFSVFDSSDFYFYFNTNTYSAYDNTLLKQIDLKITTTKCTTDKNNVKIGEHFKYTANSTGYVIVTAKIENNTFDCYMYITKANPSLSIEPQTITYSETPAITINYHSNATGRINITIKNEKYEKTFQNIALNTTIMLPEAIPPGKYNITIAYPEDDNFVEGNANSTLTVNKANSTLTINNNITFDYNKTGSTTVSFTDANGVNASVVDHPEAVVNVDGNTITVSSLNAGNYTLSVTTIADANHNNVTKTANITVNKVDSTLTVGNVVLDYGKTTNVTAITEGAEGITAKIDNDNAVVNGNTIVIPSLDVGNYTLTVTTIADANHNKVTKTSTITVNKLKTELTASAVTTTYNINKDLVITLKDSTGKALSGVKVTVDLNGAKEYTTDSNGQVKVPTKGLAPKTYTARITFDGNTNYEKSAKNVKVTVKKATPKLTAKKKTFKTSVKTKKYTITLKDNTGKAIKKAKVTLKVKGKTYKATTNSKGKATFKIKNLKKKGTFKATITYKGNKYYNKVSKKANIKVIVTFKTVSKGSKDKSTVKEIQQALKDHGYYLSYKGHYLKVDGKFKGCTERSVKQFQKDKGLKVTGKVDEKTAKKLGLI